MPRLNLNRIITDGFSNPGSMWRYRKEWPDEPEVRKQYREGFQCGGCAFFAPLNEDWGICCNPKSRHRLETVFEHFSCPRICNEGWDAHSFYESDK
ncbi:MAG: hypothetical protein V1809_00060 [Planctomycetota bacterium]